MNSSKKYGAARGHNFHSCANKETTDHYSHSRAANKNPHNINSHRRAANSRVQLKMAAFILLRYRQRRLRRRNRIFRDRTNPLHKFNDLELFWQFRFRRADILQMTNELKEELEHLNRKGALPPVFTGRRTALNPCQQ